MTRVNPPPGTPTPAVVRLSGREKFVVACLPFVGGVVACVGNYYATNARTDFRLTAVEKRVDDNAARIKQQEEFGHPDHERRITKLEARQDETDKAVNVIDKKVDRVITILEQMQQARSR